MTIKFCKDQTILVYETSTHKEMQSSKRRFTVAEWPRCCLMHAAGDLGTRPKNPFEVCKSDLIQSDSEGKDALRRQSI